MAAKASLWTLSNFINFDSVTWDDKVVGGLDFVAKLGAAGSLLSDEPDALHHTNTRPYVSKVSQTARRLCSRR